eukprot:CAMPEP_0175751540 /NCGR_PEP_ID=MMETSP0097-20121207/61275_1 /TAXON_ID=311494 /ORGANISM="Alexandrium monilatum, Strain CCMP3105" /LENGTH=129 /DNA_ID=CAMNT_0017060243 /DNA_START=59 /DNA_END=445 /DNA_ORIENTATION=-
MQLLYIVCIHMQAPVELVETHLQTRRYVRPQRALPCLESVEPRAPSQGDGATGSALKARRAAADTASPPHAPAAGAGLGAGAAPPGPGPGPGARPRGGTSRAPRPPSPTMGAAPLRLLRRAWAPLGVGA